MQASGHGQLGNPAMKLPVFCRSSDRETSSQDVCDPCLYSSTDVDTSPTLYLASSLLAGWLAGFLAGLALLVILKARVLPSTDSPWS